MSPMRTLTDIDLDDVIDPLVTAKIRGVVYRIRVFDAPRWRIWDRMRDGVLAAIKRRENPHLPPDPKESAISTEEFYDVVAWCLPDAPRDVVESLSTHKGGVILQMAAQALQVVEETIPNGDGAAPASAVSPSSG